MVRRLQAARGARRSKASARPRLTVCVAAALRVWGLLL